MSTYTLTPASVVSKGSSDVWHPVSMSDLEILAPFYSHLELPLADLNAGMMVAWHETLNLRYRIENGILYMLGTFRGNTCLWGPPLGLSLSLDHVRRGLDLCVQAGGSPTMFYLWKGYPLWDAIAEKGYYRVEPQATEYVYFTARIAELPGSRFRKLRQAGNRFERVYRPRFEPFGSANRYGCLDLLARWTECKRPRLADHHLEKFDLERRVCRQSLEEGLAMEGVVAYVDGRVEAFSLGVPHGRNGFNCMFEKANPNLSGAAAYIFRALARSLSGHFTEINAGEDWGVDYLTAAKKKWQPNRIEPSYTLNGDTDAA